MEVKYFFVQLIRNKSLTYHLLLVYQLTRISLSLPDLGQIHPWVQQDLAFLVVWKRFSSILRLFLCTLFLTELSFLPIDAEITHLPLSSIRPGQSKFSWGALEAFHSNWARGSGLAIFSSLALISPLTLPAWYPRKSCYALINVSNIKLSNKNKRIHFDMCLESIFGVYFSIVSGLNVNAIAFK